MHLNDILEENSVKMISQRTKVSEINLENLFAKEFGKLKRVKTLGFISIIEREYSADLGALRVEAYAYYSENTEDRRVSLGMPIEEEKKGKSKFFLFIVFMLLAYATWYFLTQFDKKYLNELLPFVDESTIENFLGEDKAEDVVKHLSIAKVNKDIPVENTPVEEIIATPEVKDVEETINEEQGTQEEALETLPDTEIKVISILPFNKLWFGVVNLETTQRDHFSINEPYSIDVTDKSWLLATSSAPFSLMNTDETMDFNDAKEHYFKIDKSGIVVLSKVEYIAQGGWAQW